MDKNYEHIDHLAKEALSNLEVPFNPSDWASMEAALHQAELMAGEEMDSLVRNSIGQSEHPELAPDFAALEADLFAAEVEAGEGLDSMVRNSIGQSEHPELAPDWSEMEAALDKADVAAGEEMDALVRKTIGKMEVAEVAGWAALAASLDKIDALEPQNIDATVKEAIGDMEAPYNDAEWQAMEQELTEDMLARQRTYFIKGVEILLVILSIYTLFQFVDFRMPVSKPNPVTKPATTEPVATLENTTTNSILNKKVTEENASVDTDKTTTVLTEKENHLNTTTTIASAATKEEASVVQNIIPPAPPASQTLNGENSDQAKFIPVAVKEEAPEKSPTPEIFIPKAENKKAIIAAVQQPKNFFPSTSIPNWNAQIISPETGLNLFSLMTDNPESKQHVVRKFSIGILASPDFNRVSNHAFSGSTASHNEIGYSLGLNAEYQLNSKFGLGLGALYSKKNYTPLLSEDILIESAGAEIAGFGRIVNAAELEIIEIPVYAKMTMTETPGLKTFAVFGGSSHFVIKSNYDTETVNTLPGASARVVFRDLVVNDEEGLLEGGNFNSNHFYTANLGIGIEKKLNRVILFTQPTYRIGFGKVGPNDHNISTFSILGGFRIGF